MIEHYNAFISYRHAEKDIEVARAIQRDLEHFHIPNKIKKLSGIKAIDRIFLDKDELGTASDLSAEIAYALEHADYLIVICSTSTKESLWVPREIEYFLRFHTRSQVMTVLVDGEPKDVIPDILTHEMRSFTDETGRSYSVPVLLEPLSCDYRLPRKKAKREELPRLASALLGCSYDELMNRRRQYRIRRLSLIFSLVTLAAVATGIYFFVSQKKLQEAYNKALISQSKYLANESIYSMQHQDRILAMQLALAALPQDEDDDRPVIPEAVRALTDSTLAYTTLDGISLEAVWNYSMDSTMAGYDVAPGANYIVVWDYAGTVRIWDIRTHTMTCSITMNDITSAMIRFLSDDILLIQKREQIEAYEPKTGKLLWTHKAESEFTNLNEFCSFKDGTFLVGETSGKILRLSRENGNVVDTYDTGAGSLPMRITLSPDNDKIAYVPSLNVKDVVSVYQISQKKVTSTKEYESSILRLAWADDKHLMASEPLDIYGSSTSFNSNAYLKTDHITIHCIDPAKMDEHWSADFTTSSVAVDSGFLALPKTETVAFFSGNTTRMYRISDGAEAATFQVTSSIIDISDNDGNGWPLLITQDGGLASPNGKEAVNINYYLPTDLSDATIDNHIFVAPRSTKDVIQYQLYVSDPEWVQSSDTPLSSCDKFKLDDGALGLISDEEASRFPGIKAEEERIDVLTLVDPITGTRKYQIPLLNEDTGKPIFDGGEINMLGTCNGRFLITGVDASSKDMILFTVDLATGETSRKVLREEAYSTSTDVSRAGDTMFYYSENEDHQLCVNEYDLAGDRITSHVISKDLTFAVPVKEPMYLQGLNAVYYVGSSEEWIVFLDDSESVKVPRPEGRSMEVKAAGDPKTGRIAITDNYTISLLDIKNKQAETVVEISCPGASPLGLSFYEPKNSKDSSLLLVPFSNGRLYRYDTVTGAYVGSSEMSSFRSKNGDVTFDYASSDGLLFCQNSIITSVIDLDTWYEETCVVNSFGHHRPTNRYFTYSYKTTDEYYIGYFNHYSTEELIQKARDILKGTEMSDENKSLYGLDETP